MYRSTLWMLTLPVIISVSASTHAADWDGSMSTDWFDAGNWVDGFVPVATENVTIDTIAPNPTVVNGGTTPLLGDIRIGTSDTGTLTIANGGAVSSEDGFVGINSDSVGTVTIIGEGSTWTNTEALSVGFFGTGTLTIANGGAVSNDQANIGYYAGSVGTATVTGTGSTWTNTGYLRVGYFGTGTLTISDGGAVSNDAGIIGYASTSDVTVTGTGSTWTNASGLHIGWQDTGTLTVADGGAVSNDEGVIGVDVGSMGTVTVTGTGSTWTNASRVNVGYYGTGTLNIENGSLVNVAGNTIIALGAEATGTLNIGAASGDTAAAPGTLDTSTIKFQAGTGALVFNHTDETGDYVFAAGITSGSGTATIEQHAGFTRLTGDGSGFTQTTNIHGGTLVVENMLGGTVNVMSGGTLGGSGTATGDATFNSGAYYLVEMDGTTADQGLTVQGTATLAGTVMLAGDYASIAGMGDVVIMTTDSGLATTFDGVMADSIFLTPALSYEMDGGSDYVFVSVEQTSDFADVAQTPDQAAVAGALDTLAPGNPLYAAVALLESEDAARDAYDQLSGEAHASLKGALVENGQQAVKAVNDRIHAAFAADNANTSVSAYGDTADPANGFWMTGYGDWMTTDATGNTAEMSNDLYGVIAGIDRRFGDYGRLGILGGYSRTNTSIDALASEADADSYTVGVYTGADNGRASLSLGALYTWHSIDSTRIVTNPVSETLAADYDARSFQLFAEAGYKATMDRVTLEPFAGVSYINLNTDSFSETGGMAALSSPSETTSTTFTTLGLRSSIELASNVSTRGMVGWRHAFGDVDPSSTFTIGGSGPFSILGAPIAQDAAVVEAGIDIQAGENVTIGASYEGQYGDGAIANGFNARLLAAF